VRGCISEAPRLSVVRGGFGKHLIYHAGTLEEHSSDSRSEVSSIAMQTILTARTGATSAGLASDAGPDLQAYHAHNVKSVRHEHAPLLLQVSAVLHAAKQRVGLHERDALVPALDVARILD